METYAKVRKYLKVEREKGEKIGEYLHRYDRLAEECKKAIGGIGMIDGEVKGCHLLEQANVGEQQKQMVLAACGGDKLEYKMLTKVMKRIFEGLGEEGKEEEKSEEWWEDEGRKDREKQDGRKNFDGGGEEKSRR